MVVWLACSTGCEIFAFVGYVLFPPKVAARHQLADVPTLVLIDDPSDHLREPGLVGRIADHIGFHLKHNGVLGESNLVSPHRADHLARQLDDQFRRAPVDQIGMQLGAEQVVHVHVRSVTMQDQPGLLHPKAVVGVKVIGVGAGERLFPANDPSREGHNGTVSVETPPRGYGGDEPDLTRRAREQLAERIGRDVARLFFEHLPRQPGEPFE